MHARPAAGSRRTGASRRRSCGPATTIASRRLAGLSVHARLSSPRRTSAGTAALDIVSRRRSRVKSSTHGIAVMFACLYSLSASICDARQDRRRLHAALRGRGAAGRCWMSAGCRGSSARRGRSASSCVAPRGSRVSRGPVRIAHCAGSDANRRGAARARPRRADRCHARRGGESAGAACR